MLDVPNFRAAAQIPAVNLSVTIYIQDAPGVCGNTKVSCAPTKGGDGVSPGCESSGFLEKDRGDSRSNSANKTCRVLADGRPVSHHSVRSCALSVAALTSGRSFAPSLIKGHAAHLET